MIWFDSLLFWWIFFSKIENWNIFSIDNTNTVSYKLYNTILFVYFNFSKKIVKTQRQVFYLTQVVAIFVIKKFRTSQVLKGGHQNLQTYPNYVIWNLSDKRQISREISSNFCGLPRKPELCNVYFLSIGPKNNDRF